MKMRRYNIITYFLASALTGIGLASCSDYGSEPERLTSEKTLTVMASFPGSYPLTRAQLNGDDRWTNVTFNSTSDIMGFYSATGNLSGQNGDGPFTNEPLPFKTTAVVNGATRYVFNTSGLNFETSQMKSGTVYMYFPYSDSMTSESGMDLRVSDNGIDKCVDYLTVKNLDASQLSNGLIYGSVTHEFCELIIMAGEGFEKQDNPEITVYLNNPYTNVRVDEVKNNNGTVTAYTSHLVYAGADDSESKEAARQWKAWEGGDWNAFKAWYVVLPVTPDDIPEISYIKLKDNSGNVLTVSSFTLDGQSKRLQAGKRIPLTIKNSGLKPTVFPVSIIDWNGDIDITEERNRGINNDTEFAQWVEAYNAYVSNPAGDNENLYKYGNYIETSSGSGTWHFYLNNDIDLSGFSDLRINEFKDILDGRSDQLVNSRFQNHKISGLSSDHSLIGTLSGTLQHIDFLNWSVINTNQSPDQYVGVLTNTLRGGSILGCAVDGGYILSSANVGLLAGEVNGGKIDGSYFSGFLIGAGSLAGEYNYLFGNVISAPEITESEYVDIVFTNYNLP